MIGKELQDSNKGDEQNQSGHSPNNATEEESDKGHKRIRLEAATHRPREDQISFPVLNTGKGANNTQRPPHRIRSDPCHRNGGQRSNHDTSIRNEGENRGCEAKQDPMRNSEYSQFD